MFIYNLGKRCCIGAAGHAAFVRLCGSARLRPAAARREACGLLMRGQGGAR